MLNAFTDHQLVVNGNGHANGHANGKANGKAKGDGGKVLCTTELGLKCSTRKTKTITALDSDVLVETKEEDLFERRVLLPPKVVLDSAVDALE